MQKRFRQITDVKFERRDRLYYEFWRFNIKNDHHCYMKYEDSLYFFVCSDRVRKIFRRSSNSFFFDDVDLINAKAYIFRNQHVQKCIFSSRSSFDNFDEWEQRKLFFWKKILFSLFNDLSFRKKKSFFCSSSRHFVLIFRLSQKC